IAAAALTRPIKPAKEIARNWSDGGRDRQGGRTSVKPSLATKAPASSSSPCFGGVQYFITGSYLQTNEGIENSTPFLNPVHDFSRQERGFCLCRFPRCKHKRRQTWPK